MGRMHLRCWRQLPGAQVVALCDRDASQFTDASVRGNVAGADAPLDLSGAEIFTDFDRMLAEAKLDAISLVLPTALHVDFAAKALAAGVHVLCEKPMALNVAECDRLLAAAQASRARLMVAHCVRFWPEYEKARELVAGGSCGRVLAATFRRFGSAPGWNKDNWFADERRSGGMALDLHIHDTDFIQYLFGVPKAVTSAGGFAADGRLAYLATHYDVGGPAVTAEGSWSLPPSFGFEMSFTIVFERGALIFDPKRTPAFVLCPPEGPAVVPKLSTGDGYQREIAHFLQMIEGAEVPEIITPEQSRDSVRIVEAEKESVRSGKRVEL